jgi:hypothetical protein
VLVLGEAGIGKTALLAVAGGLAQAAGVRTFRAAGAPLERDFGYGVVRQLLKGELRSRSAEEHAWLALFYHNRPEEAAAVLETAIAGLAGPADEVRERRLRLEADFAIVSFAHRRLIDRGIERLDQVTAGLRGDTPAERALLAMRAYRCYWSVSTGAEEVAGELEQLLRKGNLLDDLTLTARCTPGWRWCSGMPNACRGHWSCWTLVSGVPGAVARCRCWPWC